MINHTLASNAMHSAAAVRLAVVEEGGLLLVLAAFSYYTYKAMTAAAVAALLHSTIAIRQLRLLSRTRLPSYVVIAIG